MKLVIFDVDGTLVDSQDFIVEAQRRAFASLGLEPRPRAKALSVVGLSLIEAFDALTDGAGPSEQLAQAYRAAWTDMLGDPSYETPLYPGAAECVSLLARRADMMLGMATGKSRRGVERLLARRCWQNHFASVQTADDHPSKPAPDMVLACMEETGVRRAGTVMIGDTSFDMAMARAAGVRALGVGWGYHSAEALMDAGAERVCADFAELRAAVG
jgi:phosphoglycolate phosphatase